MRKSLLHIFALLLTLSISSFAFAQNITLSGSVKHAATGVAVPSVSVSVRGSTAGTLTDEAGNFSLVVTRLPVTLIFSSVNFETQEITVTDASGPVNISFRPGSSLGQEVVVSASRVAERILESPVSIERINARSIANAAAPSYYETVQNLKGVDMTTSSLTFKTVSTRGFNGSGNLRFNQLVDGMDNQAPGLNFSVGNIVGITELDVDNMELLQGASSALYGSGGMNGTLLINSKNPFRHEGLSLQVRQGVMHVDERQRPASPYYDWTMRWGKKLSEKFAFKIGGQYIKANDWQANDNRNLLRNNVNSELKDGNRQTDPNYDGVNIFGDEASASMGAFTQAVLAQAPAQGINAIRQMQAGGMTPQQIVANLLANPQTAPLAPLVPFVVGGSTQGGNVFGNQFVSRTGYDEQYLVDYEAYNLKVSGGLYYRITPTVEASLTGNWGTGTTVYTGADRYALKNLKMGQYKAEVKGSNWFLRGYTTQENSGDSYTATTAAVAINRTWKADQTWFQQYTGTYGAARLGIVPNPQGGGFLPAMPDAQAHALARSQADAGRYLPNTPEFQQAFDNAISIPVSKGGAKFSDKTDLYHAEGQYNFANEIKFAEVIVGASFRQYSLNSQGTIFADTTGRIAINEYGGYLQASRWLFNEVVKLTASGRYDKNENFEGRFTPRATALIKVAKDNNIRLSYQQAYRFPSTQDQWINLQTPASRLIGGLPDFITHFKFNENPAYTSESIVAYRNSVGAGTPNPTLLKQAEFKGVKPEIANSYEIGYRGLVTNRLLIDAYGYYSQYKDFIARVAVGRGQSGVPARAPIDLASPFTTTNYSFVTNSETPVKAIGWGVTAAYQMGGGYELNANVSSDKLQDVPQGLITFFNSPELRYNIGFSNENVYKNVGFNVIYRRQKEMLWQGTFGTGNVDAYGVLDAQVSYRIPKIKSIFKLGGSNITNSYYQSAFGNPQIGGLYYISIGYNVF